MFWNDIVNEYEELKSKGKDKNLSKLYCIYCVEGSLDYLGQKLSIEEIIERAQVVFDYYLDTEIQISRISDIICEHWEEYTNDNFDIYDYVD